MMKFCHFSFFLFSIESLTSIPSANMNEAKEFFHKLPNTSSSAFVDWGRFSHEIDELKGCHRSEKEAIQQHAPLTGEDVALGRLTPIIRPKPEGIATEEVTNAIRSAISRAIVVPTQFSAPETPRSVTMGAIEEEVATKASLNYSRVRREESELEEEEAVPSKPVTWYRAPDAPSIHGDGQVCDVLKPVSDPDVLDSLRKAFNGRLRGRASTVPWYELPNIAKDMGKALPDVSEDSMAQAAANLPLEPPEDDKARLDFEDW